MNKMIIKKNALSMEMALLINEELTQYYVDSTLEVNWQDCIVMGRVQQIVKNLKAAFIDYGTDKNGMLHFKQIPDIYLSKLQQGYSLPVQITKQNIGDKGHKLTAKLNISGKYLVCLPFEPGIHVSKKISNTSFREQIKKVLENELNSSYGFIVRTHAAEATIEEIIEDAKNLIMKVNTLLKEGQYLVKGSILYEEPTPIYQMLIEQLIKGKALEVICNHKEVLEQVQKLVKEYGHLEEVSVKYYEDEQGIFSIYGLNKKIDQLTKRKIWLKNGGNLIIDYTEAMTIIDVNSAKAILTKNAEKATLELNKEAIKEAILQILRRNLSGMIILDLVEMKSNAHKVEVYEYAKQLLEYYGDHLTKVYPLTELSLMQFSRTKKNQCVSHKLMDECPQCHMPYTKESFLMASMKLEDQLRGIDLGEVRQAVYLQAHPDFYEKMMEQNMIAHLEAYYPVKIEIEKTHLGAERNILCQFYKR
ncbi:MAG: ribonuclease E/G [Cellulosilyticum sp.]|nr:ribonuclease E/G [Cellulosilyticum sp.]